MKSFLKLSILVLAIIGVLYFLLRSKTTEQSLTPLPNYGSDVIDFRKKPTSPAPTPVDNHDGMKSWTSDSMPSFWIKFPDCWDSTTTKQYSWGGADVLKIKPSSRCQGQKQNNWEINFTAEEHSGEDILLPKYPLKINGRSVVFYEQYLLYLDKDTLSTKIHWTAHFDCGPSPVDALYEASGNTEEDQKAKREHTIPEALKTFISGFNCYK